MMLVVYNIITVIFTKELVMATDQCEEYEFQSPFYPGRSCEVINNKNSESHERSGYCWITDGPSRVYCGMTYTGSSFDDIYDNNPETGDNSGYYRINDNNWTYCNMTAIAIADDFIPTCAGGWRRVRNINITTGGECPNNWTIAEVSGISFCQKSFDGAGCSFAIFPITNIHYQKCVVELEDIRRAYWIQIWSNVRWPLC